MGLKAELEGGPADGDTGIIDYAPQKIGVAYCHRCQEWHWDDTVERGDEIYVRQGDQDDPVKYVYRDMDLDGLDALDREAMLEAA